MKINKNIFICVLLVVMMLACVSTVSAEDNLNADLGAVASDDAADLSIDNTKGSETLTAIDEGGSSDEILAADETVVTNDTFFNYFDENGVINKSISAKELTFDGEFSDLGIDTITIDTPVSIAGVNESFFKNIGFKILSDNVTLTGFDIIRTVDGAAIDIKANDVTIDDIGISISNIGKNDTFAIRAIESDNLKLLNNIISYNARYDANSSSIYQHVIQIRDSNNVKVKKNHIDAKLPALDVDWSGVSGIDKDHPLAVGIQSSENITFAENTVSVEVTGSYGSYTTLDTMMVDSVKNLEITDNEFNETDFNGEGKAGYLYVVDLYTVENVIISGNDILVNTSTGVEGSGAAYDIQVTGPCSGLVIEGNDLIAAGKGPVLGIYAADWAGSVELTVSNNVFDISGRAGSARSALVSAMELQSTVAVINNNYITTKSINAYNESNRLFGISYAQNNNRNHTFNITGNEIVTDGKYAVYLYNVLNTTVSENTLYAHELTGDDSVYVNSGSSVVEDNYPPFDAEIAVESPAVWTGNNATVSVTVLGGTGTVTIIVGNKTYENVTLANGTATQVVDTSDLNVGANAVEVSYSGDNQTKAGTAVGNLEVIDGNVTPETFKYYFYEDGYLSDEVPEGATLDFSGLFISSNYTMYINKAVNIISSNADAIFDSNTTVRDWVKINVVEGGNHTNISDITIINGDLFVIGASYVTIDGIYMKANMTGVGSGTGFVSIHSNAYYTTVKNSYFENGGTGSSILVLGKGGKYAVFDKNIFNVTGSSGNILSANHFVSGSVGDNPECVNYTNNIIYNSMPAAATMYAITVNGNNNLIENNTIFNFKGSGIVNQFGATANASVYRNNTITGGASLTAGTNSIIENNIIDGTMTVAAGSVARNNTAKTMSISGANAIADSNIINGAVTIAAAAKNTTFTNNLVKDAVTVSSSGNVITDNQISTEKDYAIDLKTTSENIVQYNVLSSADKMGDDAVKYTEGKNNTVSYNGMNAIITIDVNNAWSGDNNTINITVVNATGTVNVKINDKEYKNIPLVDGAAQFTIPANEIEVGLNDLTVTYNGNKVISADSKTTTFYGLDNVVFAEVFFDFFDDAGFLKDSVPYTDLIFKGAFAKSTTLQYLIIDQPVAISSDGASLSLMGIVIASDNVTIDGLKLTTTVNSATSALGDLITVNANNVTLCNLDINYRVTRGDYDAIAINVFDADNVNLINNTIVFASVISSDDYSANAINLDGVTNALVDNNTITTTLPGLLAQNYDLEYFMMGLNTVNPIRIRASENITLSNNDLESKINSLGKTTPTIQCLLIVGSENVLVDSNSFKMIDTKSQKDSATYLYAFNFGYDKNLTVTNNDFYMSTTGGKDSAGAAYALQGVESEIYVIGNNITTISNGPNLGFYVASMMGGSSFSYIADNFINVTGNATTSQQWALISGIEITNGDAKIYNNTIFTYNKAGYVDVAPVHGVSYGQYMYGERSLDVQDNIIVTQGKYTVSVLEGTKANVTYNTLYGEELFGDESVAPGYDGIVENNTPPFDAEITIDAEAAWIGTNSTVTVYVSEATGNVTIVIGNKTYKDIPLVNGTVTVDVDAADLVDGENLVNVTYNGDKFITSGNATGNLQVISGVITNETFFYYFNASNGNKLADIVPEGATLDFQGPFVGGEYSVYINKPENIVSTTGDAVFDSGENPNYNWVKFNVVEGANYTNITGISIINGDLFIQGASYVTVDDIYMKANMRGVGSGTGFLSIHSNAYYTTVKNSNFENGGTGSSCVVLGKGGKYATFDNNVFEITGSSGNVLSSNVFVGSGELPQFVNYTNNVINSHVAGSAFMYGITVCGEGNIIENNTLTNFKGSAIVNQYGATSTKNIYRNNTITGGGAMQIGTYSLVESNIAVDSTLTVTEGCTFTDNVVKAITISGKDVVATDNVIASTVTISAAAKNTTFANNIVGGLVTVNSDLNNISGNTIISTSEYAVDLKTSANNTVTDNILYGADLVGDKAVNFVDDNNNTVSDNFPIDPVLVVEAKDIKLGENATIDVSFTENVTGSVEVIVDGKKYNVNVTNGKGQLIVSDLVANTYTVGVSFEGDLLYIPTENSTKFTVEKEVTEANITLPVGYEIDKEANITVDIPGATGNVSVIVDGVETSVPLDENGTAVVPVNVTAGQHSVVVVYPGDDNHAPVVKATSFFAEVFASKFVNLTVSSDLVITGVLANSLGDGIANATITYVVGTASGNVTTAEDGSFTIAGASNSLVSIDYAGTSDIDGTNISITFGDIAPVRQATSILGANFTEYTVDFDVGERGQNFTVQLRDANGAPLANKTVYIGYNGKTLVMTTDSNGNISKRISLRNDDLLTFAVVFLGDEEYNATMASYLITVNKKPTTLSAAAKSYKASAKTKKYTVTLKTSKCSSEDGKVYLKAGKKITLKINGKTYTAKTNAKGQATFSLKITKKGKFKSTIKFAGDNTYQAVSKSVTITIK